MIAEEHAQCAIQLSERIGGRIPIGPVRERNGTIGVGMRAVAFAGDDQQFSVDFGERGRIPVGRHAPQQLAGSHVEDGDGIVVGFGDQETLAIGAQRDRIGRTALGWRTGRGIVQVARDLAQLRVDDGHLVATRERDVQHSFPSLPALTDVGRLRSGRDRRAFRHVVTRFQELRAPAS